MLKEITGLFSEINLEKQAERKTAGDSFRQRLANRCERTILKGKNALCFTGVTQPLLSTHDDVINFSTGENHRLGA